ncbi:MAG: hypothetical protein HOM14_03035 [Gammaproteobacteria bacterium]|jgi:Na+-transporting methylmalonyl-CoA/oxaloacetate decarboxylase gamma subunit|nr:hypothetical protein [Gammaproteobacteria bacterium]MBT3722933.1 hypothetical protein [Gammaproteobacteria bacterium]MBT4075876.1 hypothetical protein [Gammaproteobacteria bacterium]MBT4193409.1 hypothetical protein [Gammaproteobacteria bacterium]MBT4449050.1 hypothetical protein [Gammaproteobacteria bacterium]
MDNTTLMLIILLILIYVVHKISTISDDIKEIKINSQSQNKIPESVIKLLNDNKRNDAVMSYSQSEGVSISRANQIISSYESN